MMDVKGQSLLRGEVLEQHSKTPQENINILVKDPSTQSTMYFGITDQKGRFSITVENQEIDTLMLVFKSMFIQDTTIFLLNKSQFVTLAVKPEIKELEEFTLKAVKNPVSFSKDTLTYQVDGFSTQNDRVLSDVLKRLPGVDVDKEGRVMYEGRAIQNFYIDGMNLLEGRYNLATKNMPLNAVESVQILENHQPIKVLDSLTFTDKTSMNISLKRKNTWIGTANLAVGASPFLYQANISPMNFSDGFQMIHTLQGNNTGKEVGSQLKLLGGMDEYYQIEAQSSLPSWSEIPRIHAGSIPKQRYLFNKSGLWSSNMLFKGKKEDEYRLITSFQKEFNRERADFETQFFLPNDTLKMSEVYDNRFNLNHWETDLSYTKNIKSKFSKNNLKASIKRYDDFGLIQFNGDDLHQHLKVPKVDLDNQLKVTKPFGKQLIDFQSQVSYHQNNQLFKLTPSVFEGFLPTDIEENGTEQRISQRSLQSNNSLGMVKGLNRNWSYQVKTGFVLHWDEMESEILGNQNSQNEVSAISFSNNIQKKELSPFLNNQFSYKKDPWQASFTVPFRYINLFVDDPTNAFSNRYANVIIEPRASFSYQASGRLNIRVNMNRQNKFMGIQEQFNGLLLNNFRILKVRNTDIPQRIATRITGMISFKDPIYSIYSTLLHSMSHETRNTLIQSQFAEGGVMVNSAIEQINTQTQQMTSFQFSKQFVQQFTVIKFFTLHQVNNYQRLINGTLVDLTTRSISPRLEVNVRPRKIFGLSTSSTYSISSVNQSYQGLNQMKQFTQQAQLELFPAKFHYIDVSWDLVATQTGGQEFINNHFINCNYRFTPEKSKFEYSIIVENIMNNNSFNVFNLDAFTLTNRQFLLRPRQAIFQVSFRF